MKTKPNGRKARHTGAPRAAIYRRTSSERQGEKVSPEVQLSDCQELAKSKGYTVVGVYSDTERYKVRGRLVEPTGGRTDRPGLVQLIADAHAGLFDIILAWKEDRLYRGVKPAVIIDDLLEATNITVELAKESFDRKMLFVKASIGKLELESIRERTMMGKRGRAEKGLHHGGRVPRGYRAVKNDHGETVNYEMMPEWRGFFDDLARMFLEHVPYDAMVQRIGTNPRTGRNYPVSTLKFFLRNPFYKGRLDYNWLSGAPEFSVTAVHPAAWDPDTCAAIELELQRRHKKYQGHRAGGPFSGIALCGICGHVMATCRTKAIPLKGGGVTQYRSYGCYRPIWVRQGQWPGPTHEANFINERKLVGLLRTALTSLTPADVDTYLQSLVLPISFGAQDEARQLRLAEKAAELEGRLADLTIGLNGVRNVSPSAVETLVNEMGRVGVQLDAAREELKLLQERKSQAPDLARIRKHLLRLIAHPELFDRPPEELRPILLELPPFHIKGGELVEPVDPWPRPQLDKERKKKPAS